MSAFRRTPRFIDPKARLSDAALTVGEHIEADGDSMDQEEWFASKLPIILGHLADALPIDSQHELASKLGYIEAPDDNG